jgi:hypothetical protein
MSRFVLSLVLLLIFASIADAQQSETGKKARKAVTFSEHIAPIIFNNCTSCHRSGEGAPFTLMNFRDVRRRAHMVQYAVEQGIMPPWHPADGHGEFVGKRRLPKKSIKLIARWIKTGMKPGDPNKTPALPAFTKGWKLGAPDLIVTMDKSFSVPASGPDIYRNFVIPIDIKEDKWVKAVELRPSARSVVHHVLFFLDSTGRARKLSGKDGKPGFKGMGFPITGTLGGWAVGGIPKKLPQDFARPLKRGSDLVIQTHFHPSGKEETEKTTLGIYFADKKPRRSLIPFQVPAMFGRFSDLDIPAGDKRFVLKDSLKVSVDIELLTVGAHAHYLGQSMRAWAVLPGGTIKKLF